MTTTSRRKSRVQGIGRAVGVVFAREGADVAIVYLGAGQRDADETRTHIERERRRSLLLRGDVSRPAVCREAVHRVVRELGRIDVLVNSAAVQRNVESIEELSEEQWDRTFRTSIYGYFREDTPMGRPAKPDENSPGVRVLRLERGFQLGKRRGPQPARGGGDYGRLGDEGGAW